eukprot:13554237-Heterocapsa_arctica.AAC.1
MKPTSVGFRHPLREASGQHCHLAVGHRPLKRGDGFQQLSESNSIRAVHVAVQLQEALPERQ